MCSATAARLAARCRATASSRSNGCSGELLELGYDGLFDLELVGPRIDAEGCYAASTRAAEYLSELLTRLGA